MRRILAILLFLSVAISYGQVPKSLDSLQVFLKTKPQDTTYVLALNGYAFEILKEAKYDEANKIIAQMQSLSEKYNYGLGFYKTMNMRGVVEYSKQNPDKAMAYFLKCNDIIKKYKLPKKIYQNSLNNIGIIYDQMGDREKATQYSMQLIDFQEKNKLEPLKTFPYEQIADNLKFYKKYDEALVYFRKALDIETRYKNYTGMAISENGIGTVYDDLKKYKTAIQHYETGLGYAEQANYKLLQTDLLINLGLIHQLSKNFKVSENYLKKAEKICIEIDVTSALKTVYHNFGDLYLAQKQFPLAETYYLKSLAIAKGIQDPEPLYTINLALSDFKGQTGNYKEAYQYRIAAETFKDSIFKLETAKNSENLLRKYETGKKEQEIKTLSAQNTIKNLQIKNGERQRIFFIIGLTLLIITVGSLMLIYRNKQKSSRILEQKNHEMNLLNGKLEKANTTKAKLFSIISHDLRSPISHIYQFLDLQKTEPELFSEADKIRHNDRISKAANTVLETMEDLLIWSKSQMQQFTVSKEKINILEIVENIAELMQTQLEQKKIHLEIDIPETLELISDRNILTILVRNILQNALKFSPQNDTVSIKANLIGDSIELSIADNGNGIPTTQKEAFNSDAINVDSAHSGLGLTLVKEMAELLQAKATINNRQAFGTTFIISIPVRN